MLHGPWPALKTASHLVIYFLLSVKNAILKRAQPIQGQAENHQNSTVAITDVGKRALVTGEVDSDVVEEAAKAWDYRGGELMAVYNALGLQREKKELGSKVEKRISLKPCRSHQYFDQFGIVCKQFLICKKKDVSQISDYFKPAPKMDYFSTLLIILHIFASTIEVPIAFLGCLFLRIVSTFFINA